MNKFVIEFYNRFACENQTFHVIAKDEEDAERLFWLKYNKEKYKDCIEHVYDYYEPDFYTEEEL